MSETEEIPSTSGAALQLEEQVKQVEEFISLFVEPRTNKHLLVLDVDETIYDYQATKTSQKLRAIRPHLHEFLANIYQDYDIIIWSATPISTIVEKLKFLGVYDNKDYKIVSCLDSSYLVSIKESNSTRQVKSLKAIWDEYPQYDEKNTLICDDQVANFRLNIENGVPVTPYHYQNYESDIELLQLEKYLKSAATYPDVRRLRHENWKEYININI